MTKREYKIYGLFKDKKCIYCGQTYQKINRRISQHKRSKDFDYHKVFETMYTKEKADIREAYYVKRYIKTCYCRNGGLNRTLDGQGKYKTKIKKKKIPYKNSRTYRARKSKKKKAE